MIGRTIFFGMLCIALTGCRHNQSSASSQECDASGVVTIEGKPVSSGMVTFVPTIAETAGGHPGIASIDAAGRYHLGNAEHGRAKNLAPGEYIVTVVSMSIDHSKGPPEPRLAIPERYADAKATPLHITLSPGLNNVDLSLVR